MFQRDVGIGIGMDGDDSLEGGFLDRLAAGPLTLDGTPVDLSRARLSADALRQRLSGSPAWWDADDGGLNLADAQLQGATVVEADLRGGNLSGASLRAVVGRSARFDGARMERADCREGDLSGATFLEVRGGQADFTGAMLEDADFGRAEMRFAKFDDALLDGSRFEAADLWGARFTGIDADDAVFRGARLDEAVFAGANLKGADFRDASLRKADLSRSQMQGVLLAGAAMAGADLSGADLSGTTLERLDLSTCRIRHARFAGAWMTGTRITVAQIGGAVGEEIAGEYEAAVASYLALEQNFKSIGRHGEASWAYKRGRRMGRREAGRLAMASLRSRDAREFAWNGYKWTADRFVEWLCDYGESLSRIVRAFVLVMVVFTVLFGIAGGLVPDGTGVGTRNPLDLASYSALNILTSNPPDIGVKPTGRFTNLLVGLEGAIGIILMGLFGFVLGNRLRQ